MTNHLQFDLIMDASRFWEEIVSIEVDFWFGFQRGRLCNSDLSGLKLSVNIANPCSKLLCTEVSEVYQIFRNKTLIIV